MGSLFISCCITSVSGSIQEVWWGWDHCLYLIVLSLSQVLFKTFDEDGIPVYISLYCVCLRLYSRRWWGWGHCLHLVVLLLSRTLFKIVDEDEVTVYISFYCVCLRLYLRHLMRMRSLFIFCCIASVLGSVQEVWWGWDHCLHLVVLCLSQALFKKFEEDEITVYISLCCVCLRLCSRSLRRMRSLFISRCIASVSGSVQEVWGGWDPCLYLVVLLLSQALFKKFEEDEITVYISLCCVCLRLCSRSLRRMRSLFISRCIASVSGSVQEVWGGWDPCLYLVVLLLSQALFKKFEEDEITVYISLYCVCLRLCSRSLRRMRSLFTSHCIVSVSGSVQEVWWGWDHCLYLVVLRLSQALFKKFEEDEITVYISLYCVCLRLCSRSLRRMRSLFISRCIASVSGSVQEVWGGWDHCLHLVVLCLSQALFKKFDEDEITVYISLYCVCLGLCSRSLRRMRSLFISRCIVSVSGSVQEVWGGWDPCLYLVVLCLSQALFKKFEEDEIPVYISLYCVCLRLCSRSLRRMRSLFISRCIVSVSGSVQEVWGGWDHCLYLIVLRLFKKFEEDEITVYISLYCVCLRLCSRSLRRMRSLFISHCIVSVSGSVQEVWGGWDHCLYLIVLRLSQALFKKFEEDEITVYISLYCVCLRLCSRSLRRMRSLFISRCIASVSGSVQEVWGGWDHCLYLVVLRLSQALFKKFEEDEIPVYISLYCVCLRLCSRSLRRMRSLFISRCIASVSGSVQEVWGGWDPCLYLIVLRLSQALFKKFEEDEITVYISLYCVCLRLCSRSLRRMRSLFISHCIASVSGSVQEVWGGWDHCLYLIVLRLSQALFKKFEEDEITVYISLYCFCLRLCSRSLRRMRSLFISHCIASVSGSVQEVWGGWDPCLWNEHADGGGSVACEDWGEATQSVSGGWPTPSFLWCVTVATAK